MSDLKFEQKRSLSRVEAADQLAALAQALREGGKTDVPIGSGVLSLRVPDELRSEVEIEVDGDEIELEIELKWSTGRPRTSAAAPAADKAEEPASDAAPAKQKQTPTQTGAARTKKATAPSRARRSAAKRT
ncbi:amphi-Trp domain-containing protein [Streptomyces sp. NPDC086023]|uniref:amphi-Trp domain-containing protein n=1 Tax=Streptomyces sp. NPDC086023 TaxID=3365746 RepID=UPI0037CEEECC